jgi:DNA helicase HerA-like ATPase
MIFLAENDKLANQSAINAVINRLEHAKNFGVIHGEGREIENLVKPGKVTVIDTSLFSGRSGGWSLRELLVGLLAERIFHKRMKERKLEEVAELMGESRKSNFPLIWMMIDEAHQFIPSKGSTAASDILIDWVRQGRQPGLSLVLATQRPGRLHSDVLTQCDILLSHRLTAAQDIREIDEKISQTYVTGDDKKSGKTFKLLSDYIKSLPKGSGKAVVLDDQTETVQRIIVRPRQGRHGGETAKLIRKEE